jgi:hypothetical protein
VSEEKRTVHSRRVVVGESNTRPATLSPSDDNTLEIKESYVRDAEGNIERHDATVSERTCDCNAGDYLPGDKACDSPCPLRAICATNAVNFDRVQLDDDFEERMREEAANKFGTGEVVRDDSLSSMVIKKDKSKKNKKIKNE